MHSDHRIEANYMQKTTIFRLPRVLCKSTRQNVDPPDQRTGPAVCDPPKVGMRIEEAQSAFNYANNRDVHMKRLIAQFRRQYADDARDLNEQVASLAERMKNKDAPAVSFELSLNSGNTMDIIAADIKRIQTMQISDARDPVLVAEYRGLHRHCAAIAENILREFERLRQLAPIIEGVNEKIRATSYDPSYIYYARRAIKPLTDHLNTAFPGSATYTQTDGDIAVTTVPADSDVITVAATRMAADAYVKELAAANELLAAVTKREAGPSAYIADIVLDTAQSEYIGVYTMKATWSLPQYIHEILATIERPDVTSKQYETFIWLRNLIDDPMNIIRRPDGRVLKWIKQNTAAGDPWPADISTLPGLWRYDSTYGMLIWPNASLKEVMIDMSTLRGKNKRQMGPASVVTAEQLKPAIATMLHMYEVLIDRVYGSRKRRADDDEGSAKRAAADDSMDS